MGHHTVEHVHVPSVIPMHEGMNHGAQIDIHGKVHDNHDRFTIELLSGPHVVLHLDFRFGYSGDHTVVMNTQKHGHWGAEQRAHNPLHHHDHFHITIKAHHSHYDIHVNGHHLADFHHRMPCESVQAIGFRGVHVHIDRVHFEGFHFRHAWGHHHDHGHFGHAGWNGYGTDAYIAPVFVSGHAHHGFFV